MRSLARLIAALATVSLAFGQWVNYPAPGVPRTRDGKPNLSAPAPRLSGKPDLSGIWQTEEARPGEIEKMLPGLSINAVPGDDPTTFPRYFFNVMSDYPADEIKLSPEAVERQQQNRARGDIGYRCLPIGLPMVDLFPFPRRMVQTRDLLVILYEGEVPRQIHLDGRPLPSDPQPAWVGYSVGRWEEDTLVVETIGMQEKAPIDGFGHPRSSEFRMIERIRRPDFGHMEVHVTLQDPKYYSKPITFKYKQTLVPDVDLLEWICTENEKDAVHMSKQ